MTDGEYGFHVKELKRKRKFLFRELKYNFQAAHRNRDSSGNPFFAWTNVISLMNRYGKKRLQRIARPELWAEAQARDCTKNKFKKNKNLPKNGRPDIDECYLICYKDAECTKRSVSLLE